MKPKINIQYTSPCNMNPKDINPNQKPKIKFKPKTTSKNKTKIQSQ